MAIDQAHEHAVIKTRWRSNWGDRRSIRTSKVDDRFQVQKLVICLHSMRLHPKPEKVLHKPAIMSRENELKCLSHQSVQKLFQTMADVGNPYQKESHDLLSLKTNDIA